MLFLEAGTRGGGTPEGPVEAGHGGAAEKGGNFLGRAACGGRGEMARMAGAASLFFSANHAGTLVPGWAPREYYYHRAPRPALPSLP